MKRHIPGLNLAAPASAPNPLEGTFLARVERAFYRWHPQKPFFLIRFSVVEPKSTGGQSFSGRLYTTHRALWKFHWFLRDFGYDPDLLGRDEVEEKALIGLVGVVRISHFRTNGHSFLNLDGFAPASEWEELEGMPGPAKEGEAMGNDF